MSDHVEEGPPHEPGHDPKPARQAEAGGRPTSMPAPTAPGLRPAKLRRLALVATVVAAGLAVLVVTAGGRIAPPKPDSAKALTTEHAISSLLAGIPQRANTLGQPTAPVTLEWYGDLECPYCKEFALGALPLIIQRWVRSGQLKIEYLSMQTATRNRKVFQTQQVAALAAGQQNKMWNFIETFYHEQGEEDSGYVTEQYLHGLARQIPGLDLTLWGEERYDPELATRVTAERSAARHARFRVTPTFLIGHSNGPLYRLRPRSLTDRGPYFEAIEYLVGT
jgi:protein-disulfide isomerase